MRRKGGFKRELGTGEFTKNYLLPNRSDFIQEIWRALRDWCKEKGYHPPTYESYRSYFDYVKKLNLVEVDHVGEKKSWGAKRIYYRLNPEKLDDPAWANPRKFWYMRNPKVKRNREEKTN